MKRGSTGEVGGGEPYRVEVTCSPVCPVILSSKAVQNKLSALYSKNIVRRNKNY